MRRTIIGVMGPGEQAEPSDRQMAYELGQQIALAGWILLTGGRHAGVMDAANRGAQSQGGLTLGILPDIDLSHCSPAVDIPILTGMGQGRNVINILSSHGVVACGLGPGTLSEVALAIKLHKPLVLLQLRPAQYQFLQDLSPHPLFHARTALDAVSIMRSLLFP